MMNGFLQPALPGLTYLPKFKSLLITGIFFFFLLLITFPVMAQSSQRADSTESFTLDQCIDYAFKHQPGLNRAYLNQIITKTTNAINVSGWYPQVSLGGNFTHYFELPTALTVDSQNNSAPIKVHTGVENTFIPALSVTQAIFSPGLIYASKSVKLYVKQSEQITDSAKIDVVTNVSKAFYNLLLTIAQIDVLK
jgi:outer membrane protein TolC